MLQGKFASKPLWRGTDFNFSNIYVVDAQPCSRSYLHHGHILRVHTLSLKNNLEFNLLICTNIAKKIDTHRGRLIWTGSKSRSYLFNRVQ
jgi:hypothetical protein